MMREISFFKKFNSERVKNNRKKILTNFNLKNLDNKSINDYKKFGKSYFDAPEIEVGYRGYKYDGRYKKEVKKIVKFFNLKKKDRIIEIGCAKGFLLIEFYKLGFNVIGLDKSTYAKKNSHKLVKKYIRNCDIEKKIPLKNQSFDFVVCKDVFSHVSPKKINNLIKEIKRIVKNQKNIFILIQTFKKNNQKELFKKWDLTHKSFYNKKEWKHIFKINGFKGYLGFKYLF